MCVFFKVFYCTSLSSLLGAFYGGLKSCLGTSLLFDAKASDAYGTMCDHSIL